MFSSFFASKKWALWAYLGLAFLLSSIFIQTQINVAINEWYKDFYNILQNVKEHKLQDFYQAIQTFILLAIPYVLIITITNYIASLYTFKWREAMTFSYLQYWKQKDDNIEGSSQRIQEDIYNFAKILESLGLATIRAVMTLFAFIPILWVLSSNVKVPFLEEVNGSLVWVALFISIGGLLLSWFIGVKLPGLEYNNQKAEAAFRKELVYAEDDRKKYAQTETILELFTGLKTNYHRLFLHYGYFNIWLYSFEQILVIVPYLIAAPSLFLGIIQLGVVVQISNAFSQVRSSFSIFIINWTEITKLRSIYKRLKEFEKNIQYCPNR